MLTESAQDATLTAAPGPAPASRATRLSVGVVTGVLYGAVALAVMGLTAAHHLQADQQPTPLGVQVWLLFLVYLPGVVWALVSWWGRKLSALGLVLVHVPALLTVALFATLLA